MLAVLALVVVGWDMTGLPERGAGATGVAEW
jgi:hypothetical protein